MPGNERYVPGHKFTSYIIGCTFKLIHKSVFEAFDKPLSQFTSFVIQFRSYSSGKLKSFKNIPVHTRSHFLNFLVCPFTPSVTSKVCSFFMFYVFDNCFLNNLLHIRKK